MWICPKCKRAFRFNTNEERKKFIDEHTAEHRLFKTKPINVWKLQKPQKGFYSKIKV